MEFYGSELKETPYPLIASLGAKELQPKLLQHLRIINEEFVPKLHFASLPSDHRFPPKKEIREKHATNSIVVFPNHQAQRDFSGYSVQGLLKAKWLKKTHEILPCVVMFCHEYDPRWSPKDWTAQETIIKEQFDQVKRVVSARECRCLLVLVQLVDADLQVAPGNATNEERIAGLRKKLDGMDSSKHFFWLKAKDLVPKSSVLLKMESLLRNFSLEYYKNQAKRVKRYKKALAKSAASAATSASSLTPTSSVTGAGGNVNNPVAIQALMVRWSFKIAHYYEFRRYTTKVLQHYEAAYRAVVTLPLDQNEMGMDGFSGAANGATNPIGFQQVKTLAEYIHFKLCYHFIFSSNNLKAAVEQFQRHLRVYGKALTPKERSFEHWEWMARQYHVFAQLLSEAISIRGSLPASGLDSEAYKEPYLYYMSAAKYATYRRQAAAHLGVTSPNPELDQLSEKDFVVVPSLFVGGEPAVSNASSPSKKASGTATSFPSADGNAATEALNPADSPDGPVSTSSLTALKYLYVRERSVPHAKRAIALLEQGLHFLSAHMAERKVPRNRLKNRAILQLGIERLAAQEYEKARAELKKARIAYSAEHWWAQTCQVLQHLVVCSFGQADTAGFLDYNLQLLSPIFDEFLTPAQRTLNQQQFELAWSNPKQLGPPFSDNSLIPGDLEVHLDRSRPLMDYQVGFSHLYACVRETVTLTLQLTSRFPSKLTMSRLELRFNDERYNVMVYHQTNSSNGESDNVVQTDESGDALFNLEFLPNQTKQIILPLCVVSNTQPLLRYQETRFYLDQQKNLLSSNGSVNGTPASNPSLVLCLRCDGAQTNWHEQPKPYLVDGRVPVMGKGPGSPSFARRRTMFSLGSDLSSSGPASSGSSASDPASLLDSLEFVEEDGSTRARGIAVVILQPRAKARIELLSQEVLLKGDYRMLTIKLSSQEDAMQQVEVRVSCDPAPQSTHPDEAFFFGFSEETGELQPLKLHEATLQPLEPLAVPDLDANCERELHLIVRSSHAMAMSMGVSLGYRNKNGVSVSLEDRFEVACQEPFALETRFVHDFPSGSGVLSEYSRSTLDSHDGYAIVNRHVSLHGNLKSLSTEKLELLGIQIEIGDENALVKNVVKSGFMGDTDEGDPGVHGERVDILLAEDVRSFFVRMTPMQTAEYVTLGKIFVKWRRASDASASRGDCAEIITTPLDLPTVSFVESPVTLSVHTPSFGVQGDLVVMEIELVNHEDTFHRFQVKPTEDSDFLLTGTTHAVEEMLPLSKLVVRLGFLPLRTGCVLLPCVEITSLTYNVPLMSSEERRELFVLPPEQAGFPASIQ